MYGEKRKKEKGRGDVVRLEGTELNVENRKRDARNMEHKGRWRGKNVAMETADMEEREREMDGGVAGVIQAYDTA